MIRHLCLVACLVAVAGPAPAQQTDAHAGHQMAAVPDSPAAQAFAEANARMHSAISIAMTGDADVDFIRGMIPHHEGAVDMARIVLEHGTDPEVRKLAEDIIAA